MIRRQSKLEYILLQRIDDTRLKYMNTDIQYTRYLVRDKKHTVDQQTDTREQISIQDRSTHYNYTTKQVIKYRTTDTALQRYWYSVTRVAGIIVYLQ